MKLTSKKTVFETVPFKVEEIHFEVGTFKSMRPYHRLQCPDWVNVLPVLDTGEIVLIRQPRIGSFTQILETPGGVMDLHEKDPTMSAVRELEEETGLVSQRILSLGSINPNPAIMTNICHFFLALGCTPAQARQHHPDADERISLEFVSPSDLDNLVRTRQINHALSCLCIMLAMKYLPKVLGIEPK
jgi:ADP-ribose pyrophosphatase